MSWTSTSKLILSGDVLQVHFQFLSICQVFVTRCDTRFSTVHISYINLYQFIKFYKSLQFTKPDSKTIDTTFCFEKERKPLGRLSFPAAGSHYQLCPRPKQWKTVDSGELSAVNLNSKEKCFVYQGQCIMT